MTSSRSADESTAMMSMRGVMTSATVVSARENTPSSMSRSAVPAWRGVVLAGGVRARASAQAASLSSGRKGASVAAAARRAGPVSSGATAARSRGSRSPSTHTRPTASVRRRRPAAGERAHQATAPPAAAPASTSSARCATCRLRDRVPAPDSLENSPPSARGRSASDSAASASHAAHSVRAAATSGAMKSCSIAIMAWCSRESLHVSLLPPPHGRRGSSFALRVLAAERVQRAVDHQPDQLLADRDPAGRGLALGDPGTDVDVAHRAPAPGPRARSSGHRSVGRAPCGRH